MAAELKNKISVVIIGFNEEKIIERALQSVYSWVDEIILYDMHSTDKTVSIAEKFNAKINFYDKMENFDYARVWGIEKSLNEWILTLDCDEAIGPGLKDLILNEVKQDNYDVLLLPRANMAFSGYAPHESGFPDYQIRCYKKSKMDLKNYKGELHTVLQPLPDAKQFKIPGKFPSHCLLHYGNPTVSFYFDKINYYTSKEAIQRNYNFQSHFQILQKLIKMPLIIFLRNYIKKKGYKDGWRGLFLVFMLMIYEIQIVMKSWEVKIHGGKLPDINDARIKMQEVVDKD